MKKLDQKQVLRAIKKHHPRNSDGFKKLGLKLKHLGSGAFRDVHRIVGVPLVVKFPVGHDGVEHSTLEVRKIKHFKKFYAMRDHMPKVFYFNKKTGILVMQLYENKPYPKISLAEARSEAIHSLISNLVWSLTKRELSDIHYENIRVAGDELTFIDLGY